MNGVRSIFRRKGYLLTALSAAVLLAASSGTALAQTAVTGIDLKSIRVDSADSAGVVDEGTAANVTVTLNKPVPVGSTVTATIALVGANGNPLVAVGARGNADEDDISLPTNMVQIVGGRSSGSVPIVFVRDLDAVDEGFAITAGAAGSLTIVNGGTVVHAVAVALTEVSTPASGKIDDIDEQTYSLTVNPAPAYLEGTPFNLTLRAVPDRPASEGVTLVFEVPRGYRAISNNAVVGAASTTGLMLDDSDVSHTISVGLAGTGATENNGDNDRNRTDDTVTITAHLGTAVQSTPVAMAEVVLVDIHQLPAASAVPHPVSWTHVYATRHGVARIARALRVACDTPASRGASTGCSVRRTRRRPRAPRRGFERPGRRRLAP